MLTRALWTLPALIATARSLVLPWDDQASNNKVVFQKAEDIEALSFEAWQSVQNAAAGAAQVVHDAAASQAGSWAHAKASIVDSVGDAKARVADVTSEAWSEVKSTYDDAVSEAFSAAEAFEKSAEEAIVPNLYGGHEPLDLSKYTIGQILNWTLKHAHDDNVPTLPIHKLAYLVNISTTVQEILSDPKADLTLFAPDDKALTPPSRRHGLRSTEVGDSVESAVVEQHPFWKAARQFQKEACPHYRAKMRKADEDDGEDKDRRERRRRFLKKLLEAVLKYHVSPKQKHPLEILDASTLPTALNISHADDAPSFRIRVGEPSLIPGIPVKLNFFSSFYSRPILAKNGVIYIISDAPLLPPLSPLSQLFLFPNPFSTLTSAVQKVGLDEGMLPHFGNKTLPLSVEQPDEVDERVMVALKDIAEEKHKLTKNSFTIFAPTNKAFSKLGFEVNAFLFSPFGARALRYVLKYHVVPDLIFHTDHIDNVTSHVVSSTETNVAWPQNVDWMGSSEGSIWDGPHFPQPPKPPHGPTPPGQVNVTHFYLPTLLGSRKNETLAVDVVQYRLRLGQGPLARRIVVKPSPLGPKDHRKPISAIIADGVAWGGAVHVIPELIAPPIPEHHRHHDHDHSMAKVVRKL